MALEDNLIFMITPTTTNVVSGSIIPLTTIARRTGKILRSNSDSILLKMPGYYKVTATITFTAPTAGEVEIKIQKDSTDVPGIIVGSTVTDTDTYSLALSGIVRVMCFEGQATLTLVNSGVAIDTSNVSFDIEYLG